MSSSISPWFLQQITYMGQPVAGGSLTFYVGGSTALLKTIFYDVGMTTPAPNPLTLDGSGTAPTYFLDTGYYNVVVKSAAGVQLYNRDYVQGANASTGDHKSMVSSNDTTPAFLGNKILPGAGMYSTTLNPGDNEVLELSSEGKFAINGADTDINYFANKVVNSPTVTWNTSDVGGGSLATQPNVDINAVQTYKVKTDNGDTQPTALFDKLENSATVTWTLDTNADGFGFHAVKANVIAGAGSDGKVYVSGTDTTRGYLATKLAFDTNTMSTYVSGTDEILHVSALTSGSIGTQGQSATLQIASADQTVSPAVIGTYSELVTRFSPYVDQNVSLLGTLFNTYLIQGTTAGTLRFTLRNSSGYLIGYSTLLTNPTNASFLSTGFEVLQIPGVSPTPLVHTRLSCANYYYLGVLFNTSDFNYPGTLIQQNYNIQPWVAGKFDNLGATPTNQLTPAMGSESKMRVFIELIGG